MRDRRAENLAVEHARNAQIVDIFGAARDLGARFQPRQRAPDLVHRTRFPSASRTARARYTRSSSFLYAAEPCESDKNDTSATAASAARARLASSPAEPSTIFSASESRVPFSVAA